jgi:glucuronate isomerase
MDAPGWRQNIEALSAASGIEVNSYRALIAALENRRAFFKQMGATATDHAALTAYTGELSRPRPRRSFRRALKGEATADDAARFTGHMLMEMARMSIEDGLVMQLHVGSFRNHNPESSPATAWTRARHPHPPSSRATSSRSWTNTAATAGSR